MYASPKRKGIHCSMWERGQYRARSVPSPRAHHSAPQNGKAGGGESFFEDADDLVLHAVQEPVAPNHVEPGETLAEDRGQGDRPPRLALVGVFPPKAATRVKMPVFRVRKNEFARPRRALTRSAISTYSRYCSSTALS